MYRPGICIVLLMLAGCSTTPPRQTEATPSPAPSSEPATVAPAAAPAPAPAPKVAESPEPPTVAEPPPPIPAPAPAPAPAVPTPPIKQPAPPEPAPPVAPKPAPEPAPPPPPAKAPSPPAPQPAPEPAPTAAATGTTLSGRLTLTERGGSVDAAEYRHAVVYFLPDGDKPAPRAPGTFKIVTEDKRLKPDLLVVPKGSSVSFPNFDPILHNVFSVSGNNAFDVGLYGKGESRTVTLTDPGIVLVNCNVHHAMQANILVMDTPYYALVDEDGRFTLDGLPADANGKLYVWQSRANVHVQPMRLPLSTSLEISMSISKPRLIPHLNKLGKPYRPERGD